MWIGRARTGRIPSPVGNQSTKQPRNVDVLLAEPVICSEELHTAVRQWFTSSIMTPVSPDDIIISPVERTLAHMPLGWLCARWPMFMRLAKSFGFRRASMRSFVREAADFTCGGLCLCITVDEEEGKLVKKRSSVIKLLNEFAAMLMTPLPVEVTSSSGKSRLEGSRVSTGFDDAHLLVKQCGPHFSWLSALAKAIPSEHAPSIATVGTRALSEDIGCRAALYSSTSCSQVKVAIPFSDTRLPTVLGVIIAMFSCDAALCTLERVNREWYTIASHPSVWQTRLHRRFGCISAECARRFAHLLPVIRPYEILSFGGIQYFMRPHPPFQLCREKKFRLIYIFCTLRERCRKPSKGEMPCTAPALLRAAARLCDMAPVKLGFSDESEEGETPEMNRSNGDWELEERFGPANMFSPVSCRPAFTKSSRRRSGRRSVLMV